MDTFRFILIVFSLILWCSLVQCALLSRTFENLEQHFKRHRMKRNLMRAAPSDLYYHRVETKYIQQDLDHFNSQLPKKFLQRYFMTDKYWIAPNGPVLLYVGGEGELVPEALMGGEIVNLAMKFGALLFGVEHRYYGLSVPEEGLKLENMHFLSSQQAMADITNFYELACKTHNLTEANHWIAFGGSYPGSLAAWLRSKFPNIFYGAVASSAPVLAEENFEGYNNVVADSLSSGLVGGSAECRSAVKSAFSEVDRLLEQRQFLKLEKDFASCGSIADQNSTSLFVQNLAGIFMGVVQYNNEEEGLTIGNVCEYMTDNKKVPYQRLQDVNQAYLKEVSQSCNDNSYKNYITALKTDTVDPTGAAATRQWFYQTCSEFGYYQTCDAGTSCVFSRYMTLMDYADVCREVFEIPTEEITKRVSFTNDYYGGKSPGGTRIIFVNGSIDPWHWLSVLRNGTSPENVVIYIPGTAHCANMETASPKDPKALTLAREEIRRILVTWLK